MSRHGVLVVDKPAGPTSHDIVDRVRRALGERRVGHTGTLDPFATGVLPVCVGKATRLARFLLPGDKVYRATVRLGFATSTDDLTGSPLGEPRPVRLDREGIGAAARTLTGTFTQLPPFFSAKRVSGRRSHELAREGRPVERTGAVVTVHAFDVLAVEGERVEIEVCCSPGTYIRALARDLGAILGCGGHLTALRRLRSGAFTLEQAVDGDRLEASATDRVLPLEALLLDLPEVRVGPDGLQALRHGRDLGRALVVSGFPDGPPPRVRVLDGDGALLALAVPRGFASGPPGPPMEPFLHPDLVLTDTE
jgi:tRNA pseudouridine55 synthase